jgi:uncharacterized protein
MLAILSPAKTLDLQRLRGELPASTPALMRESERMMVKAQKLSRRKLRALMGISQNLAELTWQRHQSFDLPLNSDNAHRAALCFAGDVYFGLDAKTITDDRFAWSQQHMAILSGLYGILRPLDLMQPYRLEMGVKVPSRRGKSLYDYWGDSVTKHINTVTESHVDRTVINLASKEYASVVRPKKLKGRFVTMAFKEIKPPPTGPQMIGVVAKRTRGKMARWLIDNKIERLEDARGFDVDGYAYDPALSTEDVWCFSRLHVEGRMVAEFQARKLRDTQAAALAK